MKNPFKTKPDTKNENRNKKESSRKPFYSEVSKKGKPSVNNTVHKEVKKEQEQAEDNEKLDKNSCSVDSEIIKSDDSFNSIFIPKKVFKRLVDKKLTIILLDNTVDIDKLRKIIKSLVTSGLVAVISYGEDVTKSEIVDVFDFDELGYLCKQEAGDKMCLFDALIELERMVSEKYLSIEENEKERTRISDIDVIGIGACKDNSSKAAKKTAIDCFFKVASKPRVITKYYCITEESFIRAAEIGFHSIGAIFRNYQ